MRSESEWLFLGARDYFQPRTVDVIADAGVSYLNAIHVISGSLRAGKPWVVVKESPPLVCASDAIYDALAFYGARLRSDVERENITHY